MSSIKVTTKTSAQIAADFAVAFKDIKPIPVAKPLTQKDRLAPYRKEIRRQRRRGLSWTQIAEVMGRPPISEKVSDRLLKAVFGAAKTPAPGAVPAAPAPAAAPVAMAPKPARVRLVLDPLTGQPVTPKA